MFRLENLSLKVLDYMPITVIYCDSFPTESTVCYTLKEEYNRIIVTTYLVPKCEPVYLLTTYLLLKVVNGEIMDWKVFEHKREFFVEHAKMTINQHG